MLFKIRILNKLKKLNGNKIVEKVHIKSNQIHKSKKFKKIVHFREAEEINRGYNQKNKLDNRR